MKNVLTPKIIASVVLLFLGVLVFVISNAFPTFAATTVGMNLITDGSISAGSSTPASQLTLEGWTVDSDNGTLTGGNPQFQINGTLDTTNTGGHVSGAQWYWDTLGSNNKNVNGLRLQLNGGYTGSGLTRGLDVQNNVQGTHSLGIADTHGNFGASIQAQGGASDNSTIGDNVGVYAIANGSKNVNIAVYGRSFNQASGGNVGAYTLANIGVVGVGGHWTSSGQCPGTSQIGGFFAAGAGGDWYTKLATTSTALLLDNAAEDVPILIGRVNGIDAFTVTSTGGVVSTSTTNATNFWQVKDSAGTAFFTLDSTNKRAGVGTAAPDATLQVTAASDNATSSLKVGKSGQNKGSCLVMYDVTGAVQYITIQNGQFVISSTNCQ